MGVEVGEADAHGGGVGGGSVEVERVQGSPEGVDLCGRRLRMSGRSVDDEDPCGPGCGVQLDG